MSLDELAATGYRKTAGAMFQCLRARTDVEKLLYVQMDRRWGFQVRRRSIDEQVEAIGLPIGLPYERYAPIRAVNRIVQARLLTQAGGLAHSDFEPGVYWFYDWWPVEIVQRLPAALTVMEITDSAEQFNARSPDTLRRLASIKQTARRNVNITFAVSPGLADEVRDGPRRVEVMPNGISRAFLESGGLPHPEPAELAPIGRPRLGVVGAQWSLNHRLDHAFLTRVLDILPDWHLVLVGCDRIETGGLKELAMGPRVHVLPMVHQSRLPEFIQHFDVCSVPYVQGPAKRDALKTYEYLACGRPVILTNDEVVPTLKPFVCHASNESAFADACRDMTVPDYVKHVQGAKYVLQGLTWENRTERCLRICMEYASPIQHEHANL